LESENFDRNKQSIVILGDSHGAALVAGLYEHFGSHYNIVQRTANGCTVLGDFRSRERPMCKRIQSLFAQDIIEMRPYQVIIAGRWMYYEKHKDYLSRFSHFIQRLRENQIDNIVLMGPVPDWDDRLPKLLIRHWLDKKVFPVRSKKFDVHATLELDSEMAWMAKDNHVRYFSPAQMLCNKDGCLTMVDEKPENVITFDEDHLTEAGSEYIVGKMKEAIVSNGLEHR